MRILTVAKIPDGVIFVTPHDLVDELHVEVTDYERPDDPDVLSCELRLRLRPQAQFVMIDMRKAPDD